MWFLTVSMMRSLRSLPDRTAPAATVVDRASRLRSGSVSLRRLFALATAIALASSALVAMSADVAGAAAGNISTVAGTGGVGEHGDGGPAVNATIDEPQSVAVDAHGNLVIADSTNNRVRVVAVSAMNPGYRLSGCTGTCTWAVGDIYVIAGHGIGGYNGDRIPAVNAQLFAPTGVAVDKVGNVVIADSLNERVRVVAVSPANPGYFVSSWTIGDIYTVAGNGPGSLPYNGDGIFATDAQVSNPQRVSFDASGNLFIADTGNQRVRVVALSVSNPGYPLGGCIGPCTWAAGDIYTVAGDGFAGYFGDGIPSTSTGLNVPTGVAVDSHNNVVIADTGNQRIRIVAVSASNPGYSLPSWTVGDVYTVAGGLAGGYSGDGKPAAGADIDLAQDVTIDTHGNLLIADTGNERVRVVAKSGSNPGYPLGGCTGSCTWAVGNIYTVAGTGVGAFNGDGMLATKAQIYSPTDVAVARNGSLYIADSVNSRIREVALGATATAPCAPRAVSATAGKGRSAVHWVAPSCTGGAAITGYVVTPYLGSSALPARTYKSTATTQTLSGLTARKTYRFKVAARNSAGLGPSSAFSNAVTIK